MGSRRLGKGLGDFAVGGEIAAPVDRAGLEVMDADALNRDGLMSKRCFGGGRPGSGGRVDNDAMSEFGPRGGREKRVDLRLGNGVAGGAELALDSSAAVAVAKIGDEVDAGIGRVESPFLGPVGVAADVLELDGLLGIVCEEVDAKSLEGSPDIAGTRKRRLRRGFGAIGGGSCRVCVSSRQESPNSWARLQIDLRMRKHETVMCREFQEQQSDRLTGRIAEWRDGRRRFGRGVARFGNCALCAGSGAVRRSCLSSPRPLRPQVGLGLCVWRAVCRVSGAGGDQVEAELLGEGVRRGQRSKRSEGGRRRGGCAGRGER